MPSSKSYPAAPPSMVSPDQHTAATAPPPTPITARAAAAAARAQLAAGNARAKAAEVAAHTLQAAGSFHGTTDADTAAAEAAAAALEGLRTPRGGRFVPAALPFHCAAEYWHGGGNGGGGRTR